MLLSVLTIFSLEKNFIASTESSEEYIRSEYINSHILQPTLFTISTTGDKPNYPISNAFNYSSLTNYWISENPNNATFHNKIFFSFTKPTKLKSILYEHNSIIELHKTETTGYPLEIKIYSTLTDGEPNKLDGIFNGTKTTFNNHPITQFLFNDVIYCKQLIIEISKFTSIYPSAKKIYLISSEETTVPHKIHIKENDFLLTYEKASGDYRDENFLRSNSIQNFT